MMWLILRAALTLVVPPLALNPTGPSCCQGSRSTSGSGQLVVNVRQGIDLAVAEARFEILGYFPTL